MIYCLLLPRDSRQELGVVHLVAGLRRGRGAGLAAEELEEVSLGRLGVLSGPARRGRERPFLDVRLGASELADRNRGGRDVAGPDLRLTDPLETRVAGGGVGVVRLLDRRARERATLPVERAGLGLASSTTVAQLLEGGQILTHSSRLNLAP